VAYFRLAQANGTMNELDAWMRRKLRCLRLKQCKRAIGLARFLISRGVDRDEAWKLGGSGKGWWRKSLSPQAHRAMGKDWFEEIGLKGFVDRYKTLEIFA